MTDLNKMLFQNRKKNKYYRSLVFIYEESNKKKTKQKINFILNFSFLFNEFYKITKLLIVKKIFSAIIFSFKVNKLITQI